MKKFLLFLVALLVAVILLFIFYPQSVLKIREHVLGETTPALQQTEIEDVLIPMTDAAREYVSERQNDGLESIRSNEWLTAQFWHETNALKVRQKIGDGANVNERNINGVSIFMYAVSLSPDPEVVDELLNAGAQIDSRDEKGKTALMYAAAFNSNPLIVRRLLQRGAKIDVVDKNGWSPLMYAASRNTNPDVVKTLLANGAQVNERIGKQQKPLNRASLANRFLMTTKIGLKASSELVEALVQSRSKDDIMNAFNQALDKLGEEILSQEEDMTPLMVAARDATSPEVLQTLLNNGANVKLYDVKGKTAVDYAKDNKNLSNTPVYWKMNDLLYQE